MEETLFSLQQYKMTKQKDETLQAIRQEKLDRYQSDFNLFQAFATSIYWRRILML